jgi:hypothetical protein
MGRRNSRAAYSLIEAILATAILVGSTIVLAQLAGIGREHALKADAITTAEVLCQNKMNELLAGIDALQPVENQAFEYQDEWTYTVEVEPLDIPGLSRVCVIVTEAVADASLANRTEQNPRSFRLVRWTRQSTNFADQPLSPSGSEPSSSDPEAFNGSGGLP